MCAQEGQLLRAEKLWLRALELDAGNMEYERGLRRLRDAARPQGWLGRSWLWGSALLLLLLWVGALTIQVQRVQNASAALLSSVEGRLTDIDRRLDDVHGALDARVTLVSAATEEVLGEVESMREGLAALSRQTEQTAAALESRMRAQTDLTTAEIAAVRMAVDKIMLWLKRSTPPPSDTLR
jgi:hypothetical protein